jgi:flagellar biosynthesis/type III secretory pathway ATPase
VRENVVEDDHLRQARRVLSLLAGYHEIEDLVNVGAYVPGVNRGFDVAVQSHERIMDLLKQDTSIPVGYEQIRRALMSLVREIEDTERRLPRTR